MLNFEIKPLYMYASFFLCSLVFENKISKIKWIYFIPYKNHKDFFWFYAFRIPSLILFLIMIHTPLADFASYPGGSESLGIDNIELQPYGFLFRIIEWSFYYVILTLSMSWILANLVDDKIIQLSKKVQDLKISDNKDISDFDKQKIFSISPIRIY